MPSRICRPVWKLWATISMKRRNIRVRRSFTARRSRSFRPAPSVRSGSSIPDEAIRRIVAVDPEEHEVMFEVKELLVDPMSERLALEGKRGQRATLPDYCERARWIADAGVPGHADSWLSTIEEAAGRKEAEREYLGRGDWKKLAKRMSSAASQGRLRADARLLEGRGAEESAPRLCRRDATRRIAAALRCGGGGGPARDGADERGQGGAFCRLGRGEGRAKSRGRASGRLRCRLCRAWDASLSSS